MGLEKLEYFVEKKSICAEMLNDYDSIAVLGVSNQKGITRTDHKKSKDLSKYQLIEEGDFAYNPYRINVGSIGLVPPGVCGLVSPAYVVFKTKEGLIPELLFYFLKSSDGLFQINKYARGTVRKALRFQDLCQIQMHIPNFQHQSRILQKKQLIESGTLILKTELAHQKALLKKLRQQILQGAIEGRLTADWRAANPNAEPASELLNRIATEKAALLKAGKIKKQKPLAPISDQEKPFALPKGWEWCRVGELLNKFSTGPFGSMLHKSDYVSDGTPLVNPTNIINETIVASQKMMIDQKTRKRLAKYILKDGELVIARRGDLSKCAIITKREKGWLCGTGSFFIQPSSYISKKFFMKVYRSYFFQGQLTATSVGQTMPNLNQKILNNSIFPLPPLSEQKAIITKVEKLLALCDQLDTRITHNQTSAEALMQAVLHEAFRHEGMAGKG